jgi:hypothetical protein
VTYKAEITNTTEHLNTKYKEDQFVNIVKSHESNQQNMNSTIKTATEVPEELNKSNENSDRKKGIQHTKGRLGESLKKKKREKKVMHD